MQKSEEEAIARNSVAQEIERLSLQGIDAVNARDWSFTKTPQAQEFLSRIASDFRKLPPSGTTVKSDSGLPLTWEQAVEQWRKSYEEWPDLYISVTHISSNVQLKKGWASLHIQSNVTGADDNIKFGWMSQRCWRFDKERGGVWMCYEMFGMRGTESLMGFV